MYKQCQTEQSAARQETVEQCLLHELGQKHYEDISVSDLCRLSGVSRKSFYRYFSGKSGVLHALLDHTYMNIDISVMPESSGGLREWLTQFFRFWQENRAFLDLLQRSDLLWELVDRVVEVSLSEYSGRFEDLPPAAIVDGRYQMEFLMAGLMRVMLHWYLEGFPQSPERMALVTEEILPTPEMIKHP